MNTDAITMSVLEESSALAPLIQTNPLIRGVVFAAGKNNGFCAGADLVELDRNGSSEGADNEDEAFRRPAHRLLQVRG